MAPPPAPGIIAVEAVWNQEDQPCENTFHYHTSSTIDVALLQAIMSTYQTWAAAHPAMFSNVCALIKMQARDLSSSSGASVIDNISPPVLGTNASGNLPNNVSFALKRQTGIRGRANRGRLYMIGLPQDNMQSGNQDIKSTSADNFVSNYTNLLLAQLSDNSVTEVIYHKAHGTGTPVIGYAYTDLVVDSQRRRLQGHNRHH